MVNQAAYLNIIYFITKGWLYHSTLINTNFLEKLKKIKDYNISTVYWLATNLHAHQKDTVATLP